MKYSNYKFSGPMKVFLPLLILLPLSACINTKVSNQSVPSPSSSPSVAPDASTLCSEKTAGVLEQASVKPLKLSTQAVTESGQLNAGRPIGYSFDAKASQRFNFKPSDDKICALVYTPSNKLLIGNELKEDGKYIVQVFIPQGSASFSIEMGLDSLLSSTPANTTSSGSLNKDQALRVVKSWLDSKQKVFAPPWDRTAIKTYTTGPLYSDITKSDGSLAWLKKYNAYYSFRPYKANKVLEYSNSGQRPSLKLEITEDQTLHTREGNDPSASGVNTATWTYFFELEDGIWKIYDYRKEDN
jgi:ARC6-like, IMS domain